MTHKMPSAEQVAIAVEWLRVNEGTEDDDGEREACQAVADWLDSQDTERDLRTAARAGGVPVAALRKKLRAAS